MANKKKNVVNYSDFKAAANDGFAESLVVNWKGLDIEVRPLLTLPEVAIFVDQVVSAAFDEKGEYFPERANAAMLICIVGLYTNINLGRNTYEIYDVIMRSAIIEMILQKVNQEQFDSIRDAISDKIEYLTNANVQAINKQIIETGNTLNEINDNMSSLFGGVSADELKAIMGVLSSGSLDEQKLVEAVTKQIADQ